MHNKQQESKWKEILGHILLSYVTKNSSDGVSWASKTLFGFQMQNHKDLAPICGDFMMWLITHTSPFFSDSSLVQRSAEKGVVAYSQDRLIAK